MQVQSENILNITFINEEVDVAINLFEKLVKHFEITVIGYKKYDLNKKERLLLTDISKSLRDKYE